MQKGKSDPFRNKGERVRFEAQLAIKKNFKPVFRQIWIVCFGFGMRIGDCLALKFTDIDQFGYITYKPQKQKGFDSDGNARQKRTITRKANETVWQVLRNRKKLARTGQIYVFESPYGGRTDRHEPYSRKRVWEVWKAAAKRGDIKGLNIGCHTARKTLGRDTYYGTGKDIGVTCAALDHKDAKATLHYLGINEDNINQTLAQFGQ